MAEAAGDAGWAARSRSVEDELAEWRRAHPRATLTEIELAVEAATARLRGHLIADLAHGVEATTAVGAAAGRAVCPHCGGALRRRGKRTRAVVVAQQAQPLRLTREYLWCPACKVGLSPSGGRSGIGAAWEVSALAAS